MLPLRTRLLSTHVGSKQFVRSFVRAPTSFSAGWEELYHAGKTTTDFGVVVGFSFSKSQLERESSMQDDFLISTSANTRESYQRYLNNTVLESFVLKYLAVEPSPSTVIASTISVHLRSSPRLSSVPLFSILRLLNFIGLLFAPTAADAGGERPFWRTTEQYIYGGVWDTCPPFFRVTPDDVVNTVLITEEEPKMSGNFFRLWSFQFSPTRLLPIFPSESRKEECVKALK